MGEIADMMLDGTMCQGCGEWLHDGEDGSGYPGYCSSCESDDEEDRKAEQKQKEKMANKVCDAVINKIEKEMGAVFSPAILPQFRAQLFGLTKKLCINENGAISHPGLQKTVDNNRLSMKTAEKLRDKRKRVEKGS